MPPIDVIWHYLCARLRLDPGRERDDRGAIAEYAVAVFVAITTGGIVLAIIWAAIRGNAESIPSSPSGG